MLPWPLCVLAARKISLGIDWWCQRKKPQGRGQGGTLSLGNPQRLEVPEHEQEVEFTQRWNLPTEGLGLAVRPGQQLWAWGTSAGEGGCSGSSLEGGSQARLAGGAWGLDSAPPPASRALRLGPAAQHQPLSQAGARLVAALVARRGPGALLRGSRRRRRCLPSSSAAGGTAEAPGGWRWEAARPRTQAVAKFPRRAYWGSQLPATRNRSEKGSEIFNLGKIHLISFVRLSLRAANGGSAKLGLRGSAASRLSFGESRDSGARVPRRPGRARGCERGAVQGAHGEEGPGSSIWRREPRMVCTRKTKTLVSTCVILSGMTNIICLLYVGWVTNYIASVYVRGQEPAPDKKLEEDKGDTLKIIERLDHLENVIKQHIQGTGAPGNLGRP